MLKGIVSLMVVAQAFVAHTGFGSMRPVLVCKDRMLSYRVTEVSGNLFGHNGKGIGEVYVRPHSPLKIDKPVHFEVKGNGISKKYSLVLFSRSDLAQFHSGTQFTIHANPDTSEETSFEAEVNYFGVKTKATCRFQG